MLPEKRESAIRHAWNHFTESDELEERADLCGGVSDYTPIMLEAVKGQEGIQLWNSYVERYHILGYKRPFGAHQRYFIWSGIEPKQRLGCLLFSASAWALSERDNWIGWSKNDRSQRLHLVVNNTRFLIFPWVKVKNLASHALSLATQQVPIDFQERYGYKPVLLETFVDMERGITGRVTARRIGCVWVKRPVGGGWIAIRNTCPPPSSFSCIRWSATSASIFWVEVRVDECPRVYG